jgi:hypothetical protein
MRSIELAGQMKVNGGIRDKKLQEVAACVAEQRETHIEALRSYILAKTSMMLRHHQFLTSSSES